MSAARGYKIPSLPCNSKQRPASAMACRRFSPRGGLNVRLTSDGKTVLRVVGGRYYLPLFLTDFEVLHPGRALTTTMRYDPATKGYTTLASVTDPRTQIRIDPNMRPPYTDQCAVGADREVANNLAD